MKSILISIKPKWVAKILKREKTIEVRKSKPKCDLPIEVYIYCTKGGQGLWYVKNKTYKGGHAYVGDSVEPVCNGKVVAKFTLREVERLERYSSPFTCETILHTKKVPTRYNMERKTCLTDAELLRYTNGKGYAWHISDLEIFDKPKELSEFDYPNPSGTRYVSKRSLNGLPDKKHPPQSWCYVYGTCTFDECIEAMEKAGEILKK